MESPFFTVFGVDLPEIGSPMDGIVREALVLMLYFHTEGMTSGMSKFRYQKW